MRFYKYIEETTVTGDVEKNLAKGHVDVIGAPKYKKKKKKTRLDRRPIVVHETSVSSAVVGSRQTRVVGDDSEITVLKRQPRPLKFMERVGAYLPPDEEEIEEAKKKKKITVKDLPMMFHKDPLYKAVLMAKSKREYDKALTTLKSIRGDTAFRNFVKALKDAEETFNKARTKKHKKSGYVLHHAPKERGYSDSSG